MSDRVTGLIASVLTYEREARRVLATHEGSSQRMITIEETYTKLSMLNVKQDDLFRQAMRCIEIGAFRAAHVLSWAAMIDYVEEWFALDNFVALSNNRPSWVPIGTMEDLQENHAEFQLIEAFKACGYIGKSMEKALKGLLAKRNECAHPSNYYPDLNTTLGYLSDLLIRLEMLENEKAKFFPKP